MRKIITTPDAPQAIGPYSQAIACGDMLFVSGQIPIDPASGEIVEGDIEVQSDRVLKNVAAIVAAAGFELENVVKCSCFLKSMDDFVRFNGVYERYFGKILPARETVEVAKLPKDVMVEISTICVR